MIQALPKLIKLNPIVVKEVFNRLLGTQHGRGRGRGHVTTPGGDGEAGISLGTVLLGTADLPGVGCGTSRGGTWDLPVVGHGGASLGARPALAAGPRGGTWALPAVSPRVPPPGR